MNSDDDTFPDLQDLNKVTVPKKETVTSDTSESEVDSESESDVEDEFESSSDEEAQLAKIATSRSPTCSVFLAWRQHSTSSLCFPSSRRC